MSPPPPPYSPLRTHDPARCPQAAFAPRLPKARGSLVAGRLHLEAGGSLAPRPPRLHAGTAVPATGAADGGSDALPDEDSDGEGDDDGPRGGDLVLAPRAGCVYDAAEVLSRDAAGAVEVQWRRDGSRTVLPPRTPLVGVSDARIVSGAGVADMADAAFVYEAAVFVNLRTRLARAEVYTWVGPVLVGVRDRGRGEGKDTHAIPAGAPHPATLASRALLGAVATPAVLQSLVPSGVAGSGKSNAAHQMLGFMMDVACEPRRGDASGCVLCINVREKLCAVRRPQ